MLAAAVRRMLMSGRGFIDPIAAPKQWDVTGVGCDRVHRMRAEHHLEALPQVTCL